MLDPLSQSILDNINLTVFSILVLNASIKLHFTVKSKESSKLFQQSQQATADSIEAF